MLGTRFVLLALAIQLLQALHQLEPYRLSYHALKKVAVLVFWCWAGAPRRRAHRAHGPYAGHYGSSVILGTLQHQQ
jgi:hypothetical protein